MTRATRQIAAAAPGQWSILTDPDNQSTVQVQFAGVRDDNALLTQLQRWHDSVRALAPKLWTHAQLAPLVLPTVHRGGTGAPWVQLDAPVHVGLDGLPFGSAPHDILELLRAAAKNLDAMHAEHTVHGGLGIRSLWWMPNGALAFPDVGLTHALDGIVEAPPLAAGYRSPEVWHGRGSVPASDQYSLAAIAFDLFSGRQRVVQDGVDGITSIDPLVLDSGTVLYPGAPRALNEVIQRALSAEPTARFPTCAAFVDALEGHIMLPKSLPTWHKIFRRAGSRSRWRAAALATVAVASVVASVWAIGRNVAPSRFVARMPNMPTVDMSVLPAPSGTDRSARGTGSGARSTAPSNRIGESRPTNATLAGGRLGTGASSASPVPRPGQLPDQTPSGGQTTTEGATRSLSATPASDATRDVTTAASRSIGDRVSSAVGALARSVTSTMADNVSYIPVVSESDTNSTRVLPLAGVRPSTAATPTAVTVALRSAPASAARSTLSTGTIQLQVPSGSRIYLDGVLQRPIANRLTASVGSHDVDIVSPSGERVRRRVTVLGGEVVAVKR